MSHTFYHIQITVFSILPTALAARGASVLLAGRWHSVRELCQHVSPHLDRFKKEMDYFVQNRSLENKHIVQFIRCVYCAGMKCNGCHLLCVSEMAKSIHDRSKRLKVLYSLINPLNNEHVPTSLIFVTVWIHAFLKTMYYRGADKSLARPGMKKS